MNTKLPNELFKIAVEASPTGMIVVDETGHIILANTEAGRLFGYSAENLLHKPIETLIPSRYRRGHVTLRHGYTEQSNARLMGAGRDLHGLRQDGSEFPVEIGLNPVNTTDGRLVIAAITDLTARKNQEEIFRIAVEASPSGMIVVNAQGKIVLANSEALRLFGYTRDELLNQPIELLVPNRHHQSHVQVRTRYAQQASNRPMGLGRDLAGCRKDGSEFPLEIGLRPVSTPNGPCVIAAVTDLSARKAAEQLHEQIAKTQAHLAAIVESSEDAIISKDRHGIVTSWNTGAEKLFGYSAQEMLGQPIETIVPSDYLDEEHDMRHCVIELNQPVQQRDAIRATKSGKLINVSITLSPIRDKQGRVIGSSKVARDISERIRAESELRARSVQLAHSNAELQQFAYSASHDLQEPLRAIAGCVELLQRRYAGKIDARADEYISHAVDSAQRMRQLIEDLLSLSRVDSSRTARTPTKCQSVIRNVLANLSSAITQNKATIECGLLPTVPGDSAQLTQLFQNLISNAIKFHGKAPPVIKIACEQQDDYYLFSVSDNGIGIEPEHFERIFGLFQRLHSKRTYTGTGIGLALCTKIVTAHRGRIWVESTLNEGSTFFFTLSANAD